MRFSETFENSSVCWNFNEQYITPNRVEYFMLKDKRSTCQIDD